MSKQEQNKKRLLLDSRNTDPHYFKPDRKDKTDDRKVSKLQQEILVLQRMSDNQWVRRQQEQQVLRGIEADMKKLSLLERGEKRDI